ncbi:MAG: hypothetical protein D3903_17065 [Candidatus Electrothrix sp. GM3_4]|nr:hypothetical protein [Candidatus Electrothrix sp. GM3_4]
MNNLITNRILWIAPLSILCLMLLSAYSIFAGSFASNSEIRIADPSGDWGFPTPYRHYPRGPGYIRMSMVFDTLIWKDTTGVIPALAESWSYDPKTLSYLFTLRQGVKWHDGKPFTPADVVFTFQYLKEHPYNFVRLDSVSGCAIEGEHQVRVKLREPYAPFLTYMATMPILPEHVWSKVSDPKKYVQPDSFIGTGPYTFVDFNKVKGTYLFKAFADYYQGRPKIDRLIYIKADDPYWLCSPARRIWPRLSRIWSRF